MKLISIIIPTYNPGKYLIECLHSIYKQSISLNEIEVIIIINGDIDRYRSFLQEIYIQKPQNLQMLILESEIPGVSRARNLGIEYAKGKYLFFLDDDDLLSSKYFEDMLNIAKENTVIASNLYSFHKNIDEKIPNYLTYKKNGVNIFCNRKYLSNACCKLIPRNIIENKRFNINFSNGEDALFMFSISPNIHKIEIVESSIYYRRLREESASRKKISFINRMNRIFTQQLEYTKIYFRNPSDYNFLLFLSRLLAVYKQ